MSPKPMNVFAGVNAALFVILCAVFYGRELRAYHGPGNVAEFLIYAGCIAVVTAIGWRALRRFELPAGVLVFMQVGILAHFAGGFVPVNGHRLYDVIIAGVRFDKYVHILNALAGCVLVDHLLARHQSPVPRLVLVVMVVLGAGAVVEMVEYAAKLAIASSGVGDYDNNMRDLWANFAGGAIFVVGATVRSMWAQAGARQPAQ
jgi:uncharacterized membrane protein YjdF